MSERLMRLIREIRDFPKPGILFRDITPVLLDPGALAEAVQLLVAPFRDSGVTRVAAIESRGFILGSPAALSLGAGLVIIRKPGKLPADTHRVEYALEYGTDALEMHADSLKPDDRVLIVDDVLATGGTASAAAQLVERTGARLVGLSFLIELADLGGRRRLGVHRVEASLTFPPEG